MSGLMAAYWACLAEKGAEPGAGCPAPDDLVRLVTDEARRKERSRLLDHVAGCRDCALLVRSALRLSAELDGILADAPARRTRFAGEGARLSVGRRAAVAALAGLAGLAIVTYSVIRLTERPVIRGVSETQVRLIVPKNEASVAAGEIEFKWEPAPRAVRYVVEIFDQSLQKTWQSDPVTETRLKLPEEARDAVPAGQTYFWRVTAVLEDGQELASKLSEFSVRK
ncbi:MAG: hypothetical protein ABFD52_04095 [Acidobacteriota bacterium]